jgi:hypothetical protein
MTARSLETRITKLEISRKRPNEMLVVWRRPGGDVRAAASEAQFAPGDRVICLEWFGDGPLPLPRWHSKGLELSDVEREYLIRAVRQRAEGSEDGHQRQREPGFADPPYFPGDRVRELPFSDLVHMIFGVATVRIERLEKVASP